MGNYEISECVRENLRAAGCDGETIKRLEKGEDLEMQLKILSKYRRNLLENLHIEQSKLECLDYLIHEMRAKTKEKS